MAWETEMVEILRVCIGDMEAPLRYTDSRLQRVLVVAAKQVANEMKFSQTFVADIEALDILPDPTDKANLTSDDSFVNLTCFKAACLIDRGCAINSARQAVSAKEGASSVDLRGVSAAQLKLLEAGWCAVYEDSKLEYQSGQGYVAGAAVMTPFRIYAEGGRGFYQQVPGRNRDLLY